MNEPNASVVFKRKKRLEKQISEDMSKRYQCQLKEPPKAKAGLMSNKINNAILDCKPKYKINIQVSTVI